MMVDPTLLPQIAVGLGSPRTNWCTLHYPWRRRSLGEPYRTFLGVLLGLWAWRLSGRTHRWNVPMRVFGHFTRIVGQPRWERPWHSKSLDKIDMVPFQMASRGTFVSSIFSCQVGELWTTVWKHASWMQPTRKSASVSSSPGSQAEKARYWEHIAVDRDAEHLPNRWRSPLWGVVRLLSVFLLIFGEGNTEYNFRLHKLWNTDSDS